MIQDKPKTNPVSRAGVIRAFLVRPQTLIVLISLLLLWKVLTMGQLVYGDIPYFDVAQSKVNFLYAWGSEQLGTSVRQSLNTFRDQIILLFSPSSYIFFFAKYILPIALIPLSYFYLFKKLDIQNRFVLIVGSLFPLCTPIVFGDFLTGQTFWIYLTVPWVFYYAIQLFCLHNFSLRNDLLLASMLFLSLGVLPPIIMPLLVTLFVFAALAFLLDIRTSWKLLMQYVRSFVIVIGVFFLLAAPYLLVASSGQQAFTPASLLGDYYHNYSNTHLLNGFRLAGNNGNGQSTLGYNTISLTNIFGYVLLALTVIGALVLGLRNKSNRYYTALLCCFATILLLIGFMDLLATDMSLGAQIFQSQWIVSTIRNPSKIYAIILPLFAILLAFCLQNLFRHLYGRWQRVGVGALLVLLILAYGWPVLRGDLGLLYKREHKAAAYKQDPIIADMAQQAPKTARSLILPATHRDELNYQNLNPGFNILRLEGGFPRTAQLIKQLNLSLNARDNYFFNYLAAAGVENLFVKKDQKAYEHEPFSLFPVSLTPDQTYDFLKTRMRLEKETKDYWHLTTGQKTALVSSPANIIVDVQQETALKTKSTFFANGTAVVEDTPNAFKNVTTQYAALSNPVAGTLIKEGRAQLHDPTLLLVDLYTRTEAGKRYLVFDILSPLDESTVATSYKVEIAPGMSVVSLGTDQYVFTESKRRITLRAGDYQLGLGTLTPVAIDQIDPSFEAKDPVVADATLGKPGAASIYAKRSDVATEGTASLLLGSGNHTAYYETLLPAPDLFSDYLLLFDYKNLRGQPPSFNLLQGEDALFFGRVKLDDRATWRTHEAYFTPVPANKTKGFKLLFYTQGGQNELSENLFDAIRLYKVTIGDMVSLDLTNYQSDYELKDYTYQPSELASSRNLLADASFEEGKLWGGVGDATEGASGKAKVHAATSHDAVDGKVALQLASKNHTAFVSKTIDHFKPNTVYKVSFYYKHVSGRAPAFAVWQNGRSIAQPSAQLKAKDNSWQYYETYFVPEKNTTNLSLYFYSPSAGEDTVNLFDQAALQPTSLVATYLKKETMPTDHPQDLVVRSKRINPTLIEVRVRPGKGMVAFNESFHPGWKAYVLPANATADSLKNKLLLTPPGVEIKDHVPVNGFANGWWVDSKTYGQTDEYSILLAYTPQKQMYLGFMSSAIAGVSVLSYLIVSRRPKRTKR